jgi:hypothetical protein
MDFLQGFGGGGGGAGKTAVARSTAQTIFGGYNQQQQLSTSLPWIIGGLALCVIIIGAVLIAAIRKN